jgi:hypothetical protein
VEDNPTKAQVTLFMNLYPRIKNRIEQIFNIVHEVRTDKLTTFSFYEDLAFPVDTKDGTVELTGAVYTSCSEYDYYTYSFPSEWLYMPNGVVVELAEDRYKEEKRRRAEKEAQQERAYAEKTKEKRRQQYLVLKQEFEETSQ